MKIPDIVLNTPLGRMLKPMLDEMIQNKQGRKALLGIQENATNAPENSRAQLSSHSIVKVVKSLSELSSLLESAQKSSAVVFFTSHTCGPCQTVYPLYDQLAAENTHKCTFIKVDTARHPDVGMKYSIRANPTFITFLHGREENRWLGADQNTLRGNINILIAMAWPQHPHESLNLPTLRASVRGPVIYKRVPPLDKLMAKLGETAKQPAVESLKHFIVTKQHDGAAESTVPNLDALSLFLRDTVKTLPIELRFALVDLVRTAMSDPRFSGYYAEEPSHKTIAGLFTHINTLPECPYNLRLVALQLGCNLFSSPLYTQHILSCPILTQPLVQLITTSLLDEKHHNVRVAAASLALNMAAANAKLRVEEHREGLPEGDQVELAASLLEAIGTEEESEEALKGFLLAFGQVVFCAPKEGELVDLLKSMDAQGTVIGKGKKFPKEALVGEIGKELLGKGL
jgi:thiol-disulfide isomerase/thioredoxin